MRYRRDPGVKRQVTILGMGAIAALATILAVGALEKSRVIVLLVADRSESNEVLFDYAKTMDLNGIADLDHAYPKEIPFAEFISRLPKALEGWEEGAAYGMSVSLMTGSASFATCTYAKGEEQVTVTIWDTMNAAQGPWTEIVPAGNVDVESPEGYVRYGTVEGYPGCEVRNHGEKSGVLIIALSALASQPMPEFCGLAAGLLLPMVGRLKDRS